MHDLNRAIAAADRGMWSVVIESLQNLPLAGGAAQDEHWLALKHQVLELALQVLTQGDFEQQWEIAKIIPKLGEIAIQPLLDLIDDPDIDLENRWFGARILGEFDLSESKLSKPPQVVTALLELIRQNEDPELTAIAIGALTKIGTPAIAALTDILATPSASAEQRGMAITILAQIRHSQTIEPLIHAIDDPNPQLRTLIVEALGSFHDARIPPILLAKLTDVVAGVRKAAVIALSLRGDLATELNLTQRLRPLLFDLDLAVCTATALGLARLPDPRVVAVLTEVLSAQHTPTALKSPVILALSWIGTRAAIDSLLAALVDPATDLASEIISGIGKTEQERVYASQQLANYLCSPNPGAPHPAIVKQEIAAALGNLGNSDTVPALVELLVDPDDRVKLYATTALSKLAPTLMPEILH
jgi:HEAT repeat protein